MKKTAIILGATGLTGNNILQKLIEDEQYKSIKLFSRSKIEGLPKKVIQFTGDLLNLEQFKDDFKADEVYCCIGTTAKKTPDRTLYKKIDYGIPVAAAKLAKENNIPTFLVISAMGANKNSTVFYNKTKGEMEQSVLQQNIKNTFILRPSLIDGERKEQRFLEKIGLVVFKIIQPLFIGKLKKYQIINAESIAKAMILLANNKSNTEVIIPSNDIKQISINN
ncbi:NAD(P)H-binding protein [Polaribacter butkevichii]|uniref:Nucleoside-diphosphate sugar epimerase n=1 Tax=Polaribacter butkevichii TaxID=218490 RepID=A0A2P6CDM8_9FLAO|nr:NAD(P)H-binding protein [Polaribacter butkevichii]PQJ73001.1 nucleoside-diphosphate sugar epimerase [Polaribacter butkevichii]